MCSAPTNFYLFGASITPFITKQKLTLSITSPSGRPAIFNKDSFIEISGVGFVKASDESEGGVVGETNDEFFSSFGIELSVSYVPTGRTKYC